MDISGITNTQSLQWAIDQHRQNHELGQFQALFEQALEGANANSASAANRAQAQAPGVDRAAIREAAQMFEAYFIQMMFRAMRQTTFNEQSFIPKSNAERIFTEMMDEQTANNAASAGGIGIADMIYRQMTRHLD